MTMVAGQTASVADFLGMIVAYGGTSAPTGWLLCDGTAVSRTTYSALFGLLSTTYGAGDGSTTFNVPDLRSSFPLGKGQRVRTMTFDGASAVDPATDQITVTSNDWLQTGQAVALTGGSLPTGLSATTYYVIQVSATVIKLATSVANAVAGTAVDITADGSGTCTLTQTLTSRSLGGTGGEEAHAVTSTEMPSHRHQILPGGNGGGAKGYFSLLSNDDVSNAYIDSSGGGNPYLENTGSSGAHNTVPPYTVVNYIIKY